MEPGNNELNPCTTEGGLIKFQREKLKGLSTDCRLRYIDRSKQSTLRQALAWSIFQAWNQGLVRCLEAFEVLAQSWHKMFQRRSHEMNFEQLVKLV